MIARDGAEIDFEIGEGGRYPPPFSTGLCYCRKCQSTAPPKRVHLGFDAYLEHAALVCRLCGNAVALFDVRLGVRRG